MKAFNTAALMSDEYRHPVFLQMVRHHEHASAAYAELCKNFDRHALAGTLHEWFLNEAGTLARITYLKDLWEMAIENIITELGTSKDVGAAFSSTVDVLASWHLNSLVPNNLQPIAAATLLERWRAWHDFLEASRDDKTLGTLIQG